jgi:D-3-phosphoglycerate dehydrogenase / 2-oxoglutarate reductase
MFKILTLNNISAVGLERLPRDSYEVASEITHPAAVLLRSFNMHDMDIPESVLAIGRAGAGVNNIPVNKMTERGVVVFNAPGANANAVKELVVAGMLMASRNLFQGWDYARNLEGSDEEVHKLVESGKKQFAGFELPGRTLGVVGLGAIGAKVANAAVALGMKVLGYDPTITVRNAWQLSSDVEQATSIDDLLSRSDFITFHVPLVDATRHMINRDRLHSMKDNVVVLNFARDGIVDDEAVCEAIDSGKVYAYVTDFPSNRLKRHSRVITLPHLGASTREAEDNCAIMVAEQVRDYLEHGVIHNSVNFPEVDLPRSGVQRLSVVNRNTPDLVAQISHVLGKSGVNISHMINESRGDVAYTLVDLDHPLSDDVLNDLKGIDGLLKVRVL